MCGVIIKLWNKDARAVSVHVRHASVEVQVHCVNVVIGVVLGELHVVRVVPVVVCVDAVVRRTLVLIALTVAIVFIVAILRRILLYWKCSVYILHLRGCGIPLVLLAQSCDPCRPLGLLHPASHGSDSS